MKHIPKFKINWKCNCCGTLHETIPDDAREWNDDKEFLGYFWECPCKSTLFISAPRLRKIAKAHIGG